MRMVLLCQLREKMENTHSSILVRNQHLKHDLHRSSHYIALILWLRINNIQAQLSRIAVLCTFGTLLFSIRT